MQSALRPRNVALATLAVVAATYGGAVAIWTQLPGNDPGSGAVVAHASPPASATTVASMAGMKMPGMSR